jgi:hypothetical protein
MKNIVNVHKMWIYNPLNFLKQTRNIQRETKKSNPTYIVYHKKTTTQKDIIHIPMSFFFLFVYFEFGF